MRFFSTDRHFLTPARLGCEGYALLREEKYVRLDESTAIPVGTKGSSSGEQGLSKLLVPGALGGLAGLLVANKSSRKLLTKYGTGALLAGGGAIAGSVLWNKYKDKVRSAHQDEPQYGKQVSPLDLRTERLILARSLQPRATGILMPVNVSQLNSRCGKRALRSRAGRWWRRPLNSRSIRSVWRKA